MKTCPFCKYTITDKHVALLDNGEIAHIGCASQEIHSQYPLIDKNILNNLYIHKKLHLLDETEWLLVYSSNLCMFNFKNFETISDMEQFVKELLVCGKGIVHDVISNRESIPFSINVSLDLTFA